QAGVADDDVQPQRQDRENEQERQLRADRRVGQAAQQGLGEAEQRVEQQQGDAYHFQPDPLSPGSVHTFSLLREPSSPDRRNTRWRRSITRMRPLVQCSPRYPLPSGRTTRMMRAPSTARGILPMPPSTAAVKAYSPFVKPCWNEIVFM